MKINRISISKKKGLKLNKYLKLEFSRESEIKVI